MISQERKKRMFARYRIKEYTDPNTQEKYYMLESKFKWDIFGLLWGLESYLRYQNKSDLELLIKEKENYKPPKVTNIEWYD